MWRFLKNLEIERPYDSVIPLLDIHTEETRKERDMCTPKFIASLFIIARTWKQPRCPSVDSVIPLLDIHIEETRKERDMCTPMFITAPFIIAMTWKQPRAISRRMDKKAVVHIHKGVLLSH